MTSTIQSSQTNQQTSVWLRGLLTIAWADGHFDVEEQTLIAELTHQELTDSEKSSLLEPISPAELATELSADSNVAENFLRTAVMVALADGVYSFCEDEVLFQFCQALGLQEGILKALRLALTGSCSSEAFTEGTSLTSFHSADAHPHLLQPVQDWLDQMEIHDPKVARLLCRMIPPQCPFERDINFFGRTIAHIPPLCKLNPLYEQLVGLRFRALSYLADTCGEDVSPYC